MMTKRILAILSLPLPFVVRCGDPSTGDEYAGGNTAATPDDFAATLRSVAPYGWVGNHMYPQIDEPYAGKTPDCENVNECSRLVDEGGEYLMVLYGDTWNCVPQSVLPYDGTTIEVKDVLVGEGICGLAPEGEDAGVKVYTSFADHGNGDQVWINIESYGAVVTEDTFFFENDEYLLEGWISEDISQVYFHLVRQKGETERTLELE